MQYVILEFLREAIAANPKVMGMQLGHDSGAMSRVVDQLADRGCRAAATRSGSA